MHDCRDIFYFFPVLSSIRQWNWSVSGTKNSDFAEGLWSNKNDTHTSKELLLFDVNNKIFNNKIYEFYWYLSPD